MRNQGQGHLSEALRQRNEANKVSASARKFRCDLCGADLLRDGFWPTDLNNRFLYPLGCKTCKPVPPSERRRQKQTSPSQPNQTEKKKCTEAPGAVSAALAAAVAMPTDTPAARLRRNLAIKAAEGKQR